MFHQVDAGGLGRRLRSWFPEREFFMRSEGQVRFIKLTSRVQMATAGAVAAAVLAVSCSMGAMAWVRYSEAASRASLAERESQIAQSARRIDAYRGDIRQVSQDLQRRQGLLEGAVASLPADVKTVGAVAVESDDAAIATTKISSALPEARSLADVEGRQLALAARITRFADDRSERTERAMRKLGLDPRAVLGASRREAMGGPLLRFASTTSGAMDARFERLGRSLARMNALERGLENVPRVRPASYAAMTSGFGYRRDPFTGAPALHSGLDFAGPAGAPIYAAAKGRVSFVGQKAGYGNVVEISHGNGLITRYAHMSKFAARPGQAVAAGAVIGAIGSSGRSTGPHLHFEVRNNDRAMNPRLFLERAPDVLEEARRPAVLARR